jgi:hypothetical protein
MKSESTDLMPYGWLLGCRDNRVEHKGELSETGA